MRSHIHFLVMLSVLSLYCSGCSLDNKASFDRTLIIENAAQNLILPSYQNFSDAVMYLDNQVKVFTKKPNQANLATVQQAWQSAMLKWKAAEVYRFGPIETLALENSIQFWPIDKNGIEAAIENYDGSDNYLSAIGSNRRGLIGLEYLLFNGEDEDVLNAFADPNRQRYAQLVSESLIKHTTTILTEWTDAYATTFIENNGNDAGASITLLANAIIYRIDLIRNSKIATPLGVRGANNPGLPSQVESLYAEFSKELIRENLLSLKSVFNGGNGNGFDDYLDALNTNNANQDSLSVIINNQFDASLASLNNINGTFQEAIQQERQHVEQLLDDIQELLVLVKADMTSQLGIIVTFSDNDGD